MIKSRVKTLFPASFVVRTFFWSVVVIAASLGSFLIPHSEVSLSSVVNNSVQMMLFVFCVQIARKEPTRRNKLIFVNFATMFGFSFLFHAYNFLPSQFIRLLWFQYVGAAFYLVMACAVAYVTIDLLFRSKSAMRKYLLVLGAVGCFFVYYYYPLLIDYRYVYGTPDAQDFASIQKVYEQYGEEGTPTPEWIAERVSFGESLLDREIIKARVEELYPYLLNENNYVILFVKPLYLNIVSMCVLTLGFILLFFAYQYVKDPPQGAYMDKMMFLFLIFFTLEVLHAWSYVKSVEWNSFYEIMNVGQMVSIGVLALIGVFFLLRLRFITSPNGEFYEQEIATSPKGITRWRDIFDEIILDHFINSSNPKGRLFVNKNQVT
jgi:hypothetical protein